MSERSWRRTVAELDRVNPREGIVVPLVALVTRRADFNPCSMIELEDLEELVVAATVLVPKEKQQNGPARVSVLPSTDATVNRRVERIVGRFPRLRACAYLHSHPFARGGTWPSRGPFCDYDGHMLPLLERNRQAGLDTSLSLIACRERGSDAWMFQAFALDRRREIVDLGRVERVADDGASVRYALQPGLAARPESRRAIVRWRQELAGRRLPFEMDELFGGWLRTIVDLGRASIVSLLPVEFPARPPQFFAVGRPGGETRRIEAPAGWLETPEGWGRVVDGMREVDHVGP